MYFKMSRLSVTLVRISKNISLLLLVVSINVSRAEFRRCLDVDQNMPTSVFCTRLSCSRAFTPSPFPL